MLSAITRRLAELEHETRENTEQLTNIRTILGLDDKGSTTSGTDVVNDVRHVEGRLKTVLLRHEGRLRTAEFKLNRVYDLSARQGREIVELRCRLHEAIAEDADEFEENGKQVDEFGQDFAYNPMAPEFKPRPRELADCSASPGIRRLVETDANAQNVPPTEALALKGYAFSGADQHSALSCSPQTAASTDNRDGLPADNQSYADGASSQLTTAVFHFDDIKEELMFYKNLFFKLEIELKRKEELLQNMADALYESPDRRYIQKRKWFEHKIRLLNQDKRRRGEAIGKLIRCIEELKDRERADDSLVTEGKYAMQAALKTRGWPQEERIKTTVLSLEADRVHTKLQRDGKTSCQQDEAQTDTIEPPNG